ncbi:MAG: amidase [Burkholderiales bacterium]|nr:amidase [Burkholderiales bacterium]
MTLAEQHRAFAAGETTALAVAEAQLAKIAQTEATIGAWETLDPAHVRREAASADERRWPGALGGLGVGVKDIIATAELPTRAGSPIYADYRPDHDAACIERLHAAGAYVFGKTVTTPFAFLDPARTRNPVRPEHTPGGSSSGSAAAVGAGHVAAAIGTQTNGSVIRPASYCGVVGYKPTVGTIPVSGVHPFSPSFDTVGTFALHVRDAGLLASVLGERGRVSPEVTKVAHRPRLAWLARFPWVEPEAAALRALEGALDALRLDAEIVPVAIPEAWQGARDAHRTMMIREGFEILGSLQERERERLTPALNAAIDEGRTIAVGDYREAGVFRERAIAFFTGWFDEYDAVLCPSASGIAPRGLASTGDPSFCTLWSLLGFPALNLPAARVDGMPVGLQLAAPQGRDDTLLAAAAWCEERVRFADGAP